jgi:hypothetical protein
MPFCKYKARVIMERNDDLIRDLLLRIEANPDLDYRHYYVFTPEDFPDHSQAELDYHVELLFEAGYIKGNLRSESPMVSGLTARGHDFLGSIGDVGIWAIVKERMKGLPGIALGVIAQIGEAELRKKLGLSS